MKNWLRLLGDKGFRAINFSDFIRLWCSEKPLVLGHRILNGQSKLEFQFEHGPFDQRVTAAAVARRAVTLVNRMRSSGAGLRGINAFDV